MRACDGQESGKLDARQAAKAGTRISEPVIVRRGRWYSDHVVVMQSGDEVAGA